MPFQTPKNPFHFRQTLLAADEFLQYRRLPSGSIPSAKLPGSKNYDHPHPFPSLFLYGRAFQPATEHAVFVRARLQPFRNWWQINAGLAAEAHLF